MRRIINAVLVVLVSLITFSPVAKSEESINLQGYYFSDAFKYAILDDSGLMRFAGNFVFTTSVAYINTPLVVSDPASQNKLTDYLESFWIGTLGATWYASDIFSFGVDLNYIATNYSDTQPTGYGYEDKRGDSVRGLGDLTLRAKVRLYRNVAKKVGIAFVPRIDLDTGKPAGFTTDESARLAGYIIIEKFWNSLSLLGSLGYSTSSSAVYRDIDYREMMPIGVGASWRLDNTWNINFEAARFIALNGGSKQDAGDYYLTLKGKIFKYASFYTGAGIAGTNDVDQDNWTLLAGLKFHADPLKPQPQQPAPVEPTPTPEPYIAPEPVRLPPPEPTPPVIVKRDQEKLLGKLLIMDRVYFANGSSQITAKEAKKLDKVVDTLIQGENSLNKVIIEGYASKVGPPKLNKKLSRDRGQNVLNYLKRKGVNPSILQVVFYGDDYLNEEPEHWMNRRVEFRVYSKQK